MDPLHSRVALGLMQALAAAGDPAGALRAAAVHEELLRSELGASPEPAITALAATLRRRRPAGIADASSAGDLPPSPSLPAPVTHDVGRPRRLAAWLIAAATIAVITISLTTRHPARARRPLPIAPRADAWAIAVLPFENLSGSPDRDYAADGLTEEVTGALSRVAGLRVVARTSAAAFAHRKADVREVARALGAQAVLEGSLRQDGSRVRISAQLVNALDGLQLWSADYDRSAGDLLAVQDEIAKTIADSLRRRSPEVGQLVVLRGTEDIEAHDLYLRGRHAWNERTREGIERAVALFQGAIARDAQYAEAYSGLADAYVQLGNIGGGSGGLDQSAAAADHALQLAPGLSEAHVSRALVLAIRGDAAGAEREYRHAIALDPGYATAHHWYALLLQSQDRGADALTELRQAVAAEPLSPVVNNALGVFLYLNRDFPAAIGQLQHTLALDSSFAPAAINLAQVEGCAGRVDDAIAVLRRPGAARAQSDYAATLASVYALAGYGDSARTLVGQMKRSRDRSPFLIGVVYAVLHESDSAFAWLRQTDWRQSGYLFLAADPMLDPIRADRRYRALLGELGIGGVTVPVAAARCEWGTSGAPAGG
jgi:TolB-like protein/thioredoxin-like negative regulator of GroEL